jgi:hypothetical protein
MFEPDEYAKPTRPSKGIIIEGLDTITQTSVVTDSATSFSQSNADFKKCTMNNKTLCDDLNKQYNNKVAIVAKLEPEYITAKTAYDSCDNHKNRCLGITTTINNTETNIKAYNKDINTKTETLNTCGDHKTRCDTLKQEIDTKEKQIADLKGYIATNEDQYVKNMCNA